MILLLLYIDKPFGRILYNKPGSDKARSESHTSSEAGHESEMENTLSWPCGRASARGQRGINSEITFYISVDKGYEMRVNIGPSVTLSGRMSSLLLVRMFCRAPRCVSGLRGDQVLEWPFYCLNGNTMHNMKCTMKNKCNRFQDTITDPL